LSKDVRTILYAFTNDNLIQWFEEKGLKCIKREDGKIFPASLNAQDVLSVLLDEINKKGHQIKTNEKVQSIKRDLETGIFIVNTDKCRYSCRNLILAGGGKSYPMTGSNGELFEVIKPLGIRVTALKPSLTTVKVCDYPYSTLTGITIKQVALKINKKEAKPITSLGDLLFTPSGLSGPVIINNSRNMDSDDQIIIDFLSDATMHSLEERMVAYIRRNTKKTAKNVFFDTIDLPNRLVEYFLKGLNIKADTKASEISVKQIHEMIQLVKSHPFIIKETGGFDKAMATSGGVCTADIRTEDLSCKGIPSLYVIGEMLDIDGETGGYNLQFAFSSAHKCIFSFIIDESKKMC